MKKMFKKSISVILTVMMVVLSFSCLMAQAAEQNVDQSVIHEFDADTTVPAIFSRLGGGGAINVENGALKVTTNAGQTDNLKIDISDWAGASRKKGILTYSFDYIPEAADVTTHIMVGSTSSSSGHYLVGLQQNRLLGYNGTTDNASTEWKSFNSTESPLRVMLTFDFSNETFSCSMGGKNVSHPFSYYADKTANEKTYSFNDADKFVLYFRTYRANEYSYSIDNFKAEYTENLTYDFYKLTEVPKAFSIIGKGGTVNVVDNALNVTTNATKTESLKVDISDFVGETDKKGILTYSFDYDTDTAGVTTHIMVGSNSVVTGHVLAGLQQNQLMGYNGTTDEASTELNALSSTENPRRVMVTFNFITETFSCSVDGVTVSHPFDYYADKIKDDVTYTFNDADKSVLYFRTWCKNDYTYSIDNFKVEYEEPTEKFTVNEFAFDNTAITQGATIKVNYDIENNYRSNEDLLLVLGVYEGERFVDCNMDTLNFTAENNAVKDSVNVTIADDVDVSKLNVRAFLWEKNTYKPVVSNLRSDANTDPTVHIVGDSIYADYTDEKYSQYAPDYGIGQALSTILTDVTINNKAIPGANTANWDDDIKMNKVLDDLKKGDYVLISFCHNDQKKRTTQEYSENLVKIATDVKAGGGIPVFITAIPRYDWDSNGLKTTHTTENGNYIQAMIDTGIANDVPVINLNAHLRELYTAEGTDSTTYEHYYSKAEGESLDRTHLSETGAKYCAGWLIGQFESMGYPFV